MRTIGLECLKLECTSESLEDIVLSRKSEFGSLGSLLIFCISNKLPNDISFKQKEDKYIQMNVPSEDH